MPSTFDRGTTALAVALALTALTVAALAVVSAGAVPADAVSATESTSTDVTTNTSTSVTANATPNVTIRSGTRVEWTELRDEEAILAAIEDGRLDRTETVAVGDPIVVTVRHAELAEYLSRGNATERFFAQFETPEANLTFDQTNPGPNQLRARILLSRNATTVVTDAANDTTYVVIATARTPVVRDTDADPDLERVTYYDGYEFRAELTLAAESNLTADGREEAASDGFGIRVRKAHLAVDDEVSRVLYANPTPNQTVRGATNVEPGLNVTVVVRTRDDPGTAENESFVRVRTVPVRDGGPDESPQFEATFDFEDVAQNTTASLDVRHDGRSILGANATVVVAEPTAELAVREVEPNATGPYTRVRADADLSRGGFVVLHRGSADGPVVGSSRFLERGAHSNVTVYVGERVEESGHLVAAVHRDANQNRWFDGADVDVAYADGGAATVETGYVLRSGTTRRVTLTATPTLEETTAPDGRSNVTTTDATRTETPTSVPIPGFGIASAVVALVAVGTLAIRRR